MLYQCVCCQDCWTKLLDKAGADILTKQPSANQVARTGKGENGTVCTPKTVQQWEHF